MRAGRESLTDGDGSSVYDDDLIRVWRRAGRHTSTSSSSGAHTLAARGAPPGECGSCPTPESQYAHRVARETAMRAYETSCTYDGNEGHTLTAQVDARSTLTIGYLATGALTEHGQCLPVVCGPVPDVPQATSDENDVPKRGRGFLNTVTRTCKEGYSATSVLRRRAETHQRVHLCWPIFSIPIQIEKWRIPVICDASEAVKHARTQWVSTRIRGRPPRTTRAE